MFCADNCILTQYEPGIKINPLLCKCWKCSQCCENNKRKVKWQAYRGHPNTLITLTVNPAIGKNPSERARMLKEAWVRVRRKAKKLWGNVRIPFMAVFEETQEDEPHLHILSRLKWIPQKWLSDEMNREIGAPIVDIRRISSRKAAARYVSKYIGKNPEKFEGCQRWWKSRDYLVEPRKERVDPIGVRGESWFERGSISSVYKKYTRKFYRLEVVGTYRETEYWLVDDWPGLGEERPPPLGNASSDQDRQAQGPPLGVPLGLFGG